MQIQHQKLSLPNLPLLQEVGRKTYEPYYGHLWKPGGMEWYINHCFNAEKLLAELADPNIEYWLSTDAGTAQIIGFQKLVLQKPLPDGSENDALYLEKIYLTPAFFGRGIGQRLIAFSVERAVELGRKAVWLMVMQSGPVWVYEKAGFENVGEQAIDFEQMKEEERKLWVLRRWLKP